jgi:uncharacterized membrane protein YraQ (UPF0718 family)
MALGLATIIYPRIAGKPLFPVYNYGNLINYPFWQIPFVYIFSYITRAWGPMVLAFTLGGAIAVFVPKEKMKKYMSSKNFFSYLLAGLMAPFLTVCSCAMIPIFGGILISGAGIGPALTFLLVAPAANIMALIFTGSIISYKIMIFRFLFSFVGAMVIGYLVSLTKWGREQEAKYGEIKAVDLKEERESFSERSWKVIKEAGLLTRLVLPYLVAGIFVISFVERYLPTDLVVTYMTGTLGIILGAVIGVPTYTPTLVEVFLVKALIVKGMSASAALAFLIGAPMASIPSMLGVSRIIGWKCVISYAVLAIFVAMGAGLSYQWLIGTL